MLFETSKTPRDFLSVNFIQTYSAAVHDSVHPQIGALTQRFPIECRKEFGDCIGFALLHFVII